MCGSLLYVSVVLAVVYMSFFSDLCIPSLAVLICCNWSLLVCIRLMTCIVRLDLSLLLLKSVVALRSF